MKSRWLWLLCIFSSTLILAPKLALADNDHDLALELKQAGDILPLEKILDKAQQLHPGHVLEVELEKKKLRYIYEIETVDTKGNVWEMRFDARTAKLLNTNQEK
ncbi:hypothetical protein MNBD_GAMMA24-1931 [hydrothermal vent metagenome]|uniref:PepSY domain-containing protein n=1 Tax=hydrothermal vent metagenome TaxID=652676 RepID=A0A3B1BFF3_9ZZZZ